MRLEVWMKINRPVRAPDLMGMPQIGVELPVPACESTDNSDSYYPVGGVLSVVCLFPGGARGCAANWEGNMTTLLNFPVAVFLVALSGLWASSWIGAFWRRRRHPAEANQHDLDFVIGAILTLLGLLIGFSFSMAINRYDQRKNYEEEEANAIGTEYVRADFLPQTEATKLKGLLVKYLGQRIEYYQERDLQRRSELALQTAQLQDEMWAEVRAAASANPTPVMTVVVTGMNDVLNRQGYTQAAWWNRLPIAAWGLMGAISLVCSTLIGFEAQRPKGSLFLMVPLAVSISFLLIADIDSPRGGMIRVVPQNLISLQKSIPAQ
jgi:hypothetical protein